MMNLIKKGFNKFTLLVPVLAFGAVVGLAPMAGAVDCNLNSPNIGVKTGKDCAKSDDQKGNIGNVFETITNVLLFIIGAVAVIMIILGGIRYTISNGDSNQITSAKNTILYGVIGIIVALLAYAIVNFVVGAFTAGNGGGGNNGTSGAAS
jgi:uncharacterized Tic20 family protein